MEPYQVASEKMRRSGEMPINLAKNVGISAIGGAAARLGTQAASKLIPRISALINDYVPENIATKGLEKIDPRFKKFMEGASESGYTFDDIKEFMKEKISKSEPAKENRNIIEQYSPELFSFIKEKVNSGMSPIQAGEIAQREGKFSDPIKKIEKDHKTNWLRVLELLFGSGKDAQAQQAQVRPAQQDQQELQQPGQQQPGQGQAALMAVLQKLQQARGGQ